MAAEMETLVVDLLTKCYYHQAHILATQRAARPEESYAPPPLPVTHLPESLEEPTA